MAKIEISITKTRKEKFYKKKDFDKYFLLERNLTHLNASMKNIPPKKMDILPRDQIKKIIQLFAEKTSTPENFAGAGIPEFIQGFGSYSSRPSITRIVNGKKNMNSKFDV
jgi:hypothetical protein